MSHSATYRTSLAFLASGLVLLCFADLGISTLHPWLELGRMVHGALTPNFLAANILLPSLAMTVAFAFMGVVLGASVGFCLALVFHVRAVRTACAFVRAIHELFWALIFLQVLGLNPVTGVMAIAVPYAGTFAKVYAEIIEETDKAPLRALPVGTSLLSAFFFARLPQSWRRMRSYTSYRFECSMRSSAVLGFVGLPTLGYQLDAYFQVGKYSEVAALLFLFYLLIGTLRLWMRPRLVPLYGIASLWLLWGPVTSSWANVHRFLTRDIVPYPLRGAPLNNPATWHALGHWAGMLTTQQALPGAWATVVLSQIALVATGILTLLWFPLVSRHFLGRFGRLAGHTFLVVVRSTPEYILAYVLLQLWGPSMLPAIVALALHNGAIIGHLIGQHSNEIELRPDAPRGLNRYGYEVLPRVYPQFLAFLFYRWEIIIRETSILGILGVRTLGFYVDSAIAEIRTDRMMFLILITALLNIAVDAFSRDLRAKLKLSSGVDVG